MTSSIEFAIRVEGGSIFQFFKSIANEFFIEEDRYICCVLEGLDHMSYHILCYFSVTAAFEGLLSEQKKIQKLKIKIKCF